MKKILLFAAAAFTLFACDDPEPDTPQESADKIAISAEERTFGNEGGSFSVIVTSSADWTLTSEEEYNWVTPSVTTGADGDIVRFTVSANNTDADLTAAWTFNVGEAHADLVITSLAKPLANIEVGETDVILDYNSGELNVIVTSEVEYRDLQQTVSIVSGDEGWLKYVVTLPGDEANTARMVFSYDALSSLDDRSATIAVTAADAVTVEVNVLQEAKHVLSTEKGFYTLAVEGETVTIPVTANVEYKIEIEQDGNWLSYGEKTAEGVPFTAAALPGDNRAKRAATVTFTQTDAKEGEDPLSATISVTQVNALITWAADMTQNRLFPKWEGGTLGKAEEVTLEALINADEFNNSISSVMGIEGVLLLRFGDSAPKNVLQIATPVGNYDVYIDDANDVGFETNRWYHIALTFSQYNGGSWWYGSFKLYVDGVLKAEQNDIRWYAYSWSGTVNGVDFSPAWSYEPSGTRCFWFGYSYESSRYFSGKMTELRIWNRVLTEEEINAENHFYTVDPKSEGLFSYWKFEEGSGSTIEDATGNGNTLYGETNVRQQGSDNKGDAGISWVEVALPDR